MMLPKRLLEMCLFAAVVIIAWHGVAIVTTEAATGAAPDRSGELLYQIDEMPVDDVLAGGPL